MQLIKDDVSGLFRLEGRFGTVVNFNTSNQISSWQDVDNNTLNFSYNATTGKLETVTDYVNRTLTLGYDATSGLLNSVIDSTGRSVSYGYDASEDLTSFTDVESKPWGYAYDDPNNLHRITSLTDPLTITTATNTYNIFGRVESHTEARQDPLDPQNVLYGEYKFYFTGFRNVDEDPNGNQKAFYFDTRGRLYATEDALGNKNSWKYDGQNHKILETDPRGYITTYNYDGNQNLTDTFNALNQQTRNIYDTDLRLQYSIDPLYHGSSFGYDTENHPTSSTYGHLFDNLTLLPLDSGISQTASTYYPNGQTNTTTDGRNTLTTLTYDSYGNSDTTQVSAHPAVDYTYDAIGRMEDLKDQEYLNTNVSTGFTYNNRGQVLTVTDKLGRQTIFTYDDAGRMISRKDRNLDTINYDYTPTGKLETVTYPTGPPVSFTYDLTDNLETMVDNIGTTQYFYDAAYRLSSMTNPYGFVVSYDKYDAAGNLEEITYPGSKKVIYTYDELNRIKTVTIDWLIPTQTATYFYDDAGRLDYVQNFNGTITDYDYDNANRLIALNNNKSDASIIATYSFPVLDGNGNREQVLQDEPLASSLSAESVSFQYNNAKNRLEWAGATNFAYDNEGQLSQRDGVPYTTFDYEHRLVSSADGITSVQYVYDGKGNRLQATRNGVVTRYIYDAAGNLIAEADGNNNITRYYIYGAGLLAMVDTSDAVYTYHFNANGNTIAITDASQTMVNKYAYTPFGRLANEVETSFSQPFKFVGQHGVMTEPNGFYYMLARYYDPEVGRFISEDPIGFEGGDVNFYAYVANNPINKIDPSGLWAFFGGWSARAGAYGIGNAAVTEGVIWGSSRFSDRQNGLATEAFFSYETGENTWGAEVGGEVLGGFFTGDVEDFSGVSDSWNITFGPYSFSYFNTPSGDLGFSFGRGIGRNIGSISKTSVNTDVTCVIK